MAQAHAVRSGANGQPEVGSAAKVKVVLPAYNEVDNLPALCDALERERTRGLDLFVVLVDDGSSDETASVVRERTDGPPMKVLENEVNKGLGATFARGMRAAVELSGPGDVIVCMDADDSHRPEQIPDLVAAIESGADVVVASRFRRGARIKGVPVHRRVLARGMSWLFRAVSPVRGVRDYSTGYRAYRAELLARALESDGDELFDTSGFGCMVALLMKLSAHGARCEEIPVDLRYDRKKGESKMRIGPTMVHNLRVLARAGTARRFKR